MEDDQLKRIGGFPSQERPNDQKGWGYVTSYIRQMHRLADTLSSELAWEALYGNLGTGHVPPVWAMRTRAERIRAFTRGLWPGDEYKRVHNLNGPNASNVDVLMNIDWTPPKDHVPHCDRLRDILSNRDTKPKIKVTNVSAQDKFMQGIIKKMVAVQVAEDAELAGASKSMGVDPTPPQGDPQTMMEFEIMSRLGGKMAGAVAVRHVIDACMESNRYMQELRPQIADALIDDGPCILVSRRQARGMPRIKRIRFEACHLPQTDDGWLDPPRFGYYHRMTPGEIMAEMGSESTPDIRKRLQKLGAANSGLRKGFGEPFSTVQNLESGILVFTGMFKDYYIIEAVEDKATKIRKDMSEMPEGWEMDPAKHEIIRRTYEVVFEGSMVVGTETWEGWDGPQDIDPQDHANDKGMIAWGVSLSYSTARMRGALRSCRLPVSIGVYNMTNMTLESIGGRLMAAYRDFVMLTLQFRSMIMNIKPSAMVIDSEWLDRVVAMNEAGQKERGDLVRQLRDGGVIEVQTRDPEDEASRLNSTPVTAGVHVFPETIPDFERVIGALEYAMQRFERVGGFNAATNGQTLDERQAVRNVNMMQQSQAKALKPMLDCMDRMEGRLWEIVYAQVSAAIYAGDEIEYMGPMIGQSAAKFVRLTADNDPLSLSIAMEQGMSDNERLDLNEMLSQAVAAGTITPSERFLIGDVEDKREAAMMLDILSERRAMKAQQDKLQVIEADGQKVVAAGQQQMEAMNAKSQLDMQAALAQIQAKSEAETAKQMLLHEQWKERFAEEADERMGAVMDKLDAMLAGIRETNASKERIAAHQGTVQLEVSDDSNETALKIADAKEREKKEKEDDKDSD